MDSIYFKLDPRLHMKISASIAIITLIFFTICVLDSYAVSIQIPVWVKNTARWWSEGQVNNSDFIKGIQYLIDQKIMQIPKTNSSLVTQNEIPLWVKNTAGWWANGTINDYDFVQGIQYLVQENIIHIAPTQTFELSSTAFENNGTIPSQYTCDGNGMSPPLTISGVPQTAQSLALTVVDIDAPRGPFTHWTMWNIPTNATEFSVGENISFSQGMTSAGKIGYKSPCPPSGTHRYFFTLYALDTVLNLGQNTTRDVLEQTIAGHILDKSVLMGTYSR